MSIEGAGRCQRAPDAGMMHAIGAACYQLGSFCQNWPGGTAGGGSPALNPEDAPNCVPSFEPLPWSPKNSHKRGAGARLKPARVAALRGGIGRVTAA
jgi:hypothetical protein